ncbi:hypothetical protein G7Y89_g14474 [Cudoniella acicularis]|uniref:Uncharacterized protein n=1 Tax=Cudoniella acicularis TaxID=354080 RepID=A0A8H4R336_9HELO|nr:hypothetical protein G7Y89_g14474 [Cudoniella acicularis]
MLEQIEDDYSQPRFVSKIFNFIVTPFHYRRVNLKVKLTQLMDCPASQKLYYNISKFTRHLFLTEEYYDPKKIDTQLADIVSRCELLEEITPVPVSLRKVIEEKFPNFRLHIQDLYCDNELSARSIPMESLVSAKLREHTDCLPRRLSRFRRINIVGLFKEALRLESFHLIVQYNPIRTDEVLPGSVPAAKELVLPFWLQYSPKTLDLSKMESLSTDFRYGTSRLLRALPAQPVSQLKALKLVARIGDWPQLGFREQLGGMIEAIDALEVFHLRCDLHAFNLEWLIKHCNSLRELVLGQLHKMYSTEICKGVMGFSIGCIQDLQQYFPKLETLALDLGAKTSYIQTFPKALSQFPALRDLTIRVPVTSRMNGGWASIGNRNFVIKVARLLMSSKWDTLRKLTVNMDGYDEGYDWKPQVRKGFHPRLSVITQRASLVVRDAILEERKGRLGKEVVHSEIIEICNGHLLGGPSGDYGGRAT